MNEFGITAEQLAYSSIAAMQRQLDEKDLIIEEQRKQIELITQDRRMILENQGKQLDHIRDSRNFNRQQVMAIINELHVVSDDLRV